MRTFFYSCFLFIGITANAQVSPPIWSTPVRNHFTASCTRDGGIFVIGTGTSVVSCSAAYAYSALLLNNGGLNWEQAYDTSNCNNENAMSCAFTSSQAPCYAIPTSNSSTLDTGRIVIYNRSGNVLSDSIWEFINNGGGEVPIVGNMGDDFFYYSRSTIVFKTDTLGNVLWTYTGSDSVYRASVLFDSIHSLILIASIDLRFSDWVTNLTGLDTAGNLIFDVDHNFFTAPYETPLSVWISPNQNLYGFTKEGSSFEHKAFGLDTSGNLLWERLVTSYLHSDYDSVNNVLHYVSKVTNQIKKCYSIDCQTGQLLDSITIDSCGLTWPYVKVDKYGNVYLAYGLSNAAIPTDRVEQFNPDYTYNWRGEYTDASNYLLHGLYISDSCKVFLINDRSSASMVSKFDPPIINSIEEKMSISAFSVFPNPASDHCYYQLSANPENNLRYEICDISGKILMDGKCSAGGYGEINLSTLSPSFYFISIRNEKGELVASPQKIIKL